MCGIAGIFSANDLPDLALQLERMQRKLVHRGPDGQGIYTNHKNLGLAHRRLSILDLDESAGQPMSSEHLTIVFNGEIYNFIEIRNDLQKLGHVFKTHSDTEVVLHAYLEWGSDCIRQFNGMFAFAIWDQKQKKLTMFRDRVGKKPFYYYFDPIQKIFIFSSELKSILQCTYIKDRTLDSNALYFFLKLGFIPAPYTPFKEIKKLEQATKCSIDQSFDLSFEKYWDLGSQVKQTSKKYLKEEIKELFYDSVKIRMRSDVPVGVLLSGGIDSTLVFSLARKISSEHLKSFTSSFDVGSRSEKYNHDSVNAYKTSQVFNSSFNQLTVKNSENFWNDFNSAVYSMDEPHFAPTFLTQFYLSRFIKEKGVTVVLDGLGGDELFGGYHRYHYDYYVDLFNKIPSFIKSKSGFITNFFPQYKKLLEKSALPKFSHQRFFTWWGLHDDQEIDRALNFSHGQGDQLLSNLLGRNINIANFESHQDAMMALDLKLWVGESQCMNSDRMNMAHGVENRSPFLDYRLVELALKIPYLEKCNPLKPKQLLLDSFDHQEIPNYVRASPKRGWMSPVYYWLKDYIPEHLEEKMSELRKNSNFSALVPGDIGAVLHQKPQQIWSLLVYSSWQDSYLN